MNEIMRRLHIGRATLVIEMMPDNDPDLDWIGTFSNEWKEGCILHSTNPREYKYFHPQPGLEEYAELDYQRMKAYMRGEWSMVGIRAELRIDGRTIGRSYGLWGIEWEGDIADYHREIAHEQARDAIQDARDFLQSLKG